MKRILALSFFCFMLGACQSVQHNTPSSRPEVTVKATPDVTKSVFVGTLLNAGYNIKSDSQFQVVVERDSQNAMASVLLGSNYDHRVFARISATFVQLGQTTRMVADMNLVTNPGSAFEKQLSMTTSQDSLRLQQFLNDIKQGLDDGRKPEQLIADLTAKIRARQAAAR